MSTTEERRRPDLASLKIERAEEERAERPRFLRFIVIALLLGLAAVLVYRNFVIPARQPVVELLTVRPSADNANQPLLTASGYLIADRQASVTSKIPGQVRRINFDIGSKVKRGDLLVVLDSAELQAQMSEAVAARDEALREQRRQRSLFADGVTSRALVDSADSQAQIASARVARLQVNLGDMIVRAPFDGTITTRNVELGEMVAPTTMGTVPGSRAGAGSIATLADLDSLELEADVNESNVGQLRAGQPAEVTVDAFPGKKWRAEVRQIIPRADRAKGVVQVRVKLLDDKSGLLPDMSSSVAFLERARTAEELAKKPAIWIPEAALGTDGGKNFVVTIDEEQRAVRRPVTIGAREGGRIEIVTGLKSGDRIVAKDVLSLRQGEKVRLPKEEEE
jgi:RND family efflux transporter MFP subunit